MNAPRPYRMRKTATLRGHELVREVVLERLRDVSPADIELEAQLREQRPRFREDCVDGPRPCPWVSCRHHLYLDVTYAGSITLNFPELEPEQMATSCALDVADQQGITLEEVGDLMNLARERVRQVETKALRKITALGFDLGGLG